MRSRGHRHVLLGCEPMTKTAVAIMMGVTALAYAVGGWDLLIVCSLLLLIIAWE